jgi:hypothetical protein
LPLRPFNLEQARKLQQAWSEFLGIPVEWKNALGMELVLIPPGRYLMGGELAAGEIARRTGMEARLFEHEHPQHLVWCCDATGFRIALIPQLASAKSH